mgnify:CR=1 FL=1
MKRILGILGWLGVVLVLAAVVNLALMGLARRQRERPGDCGRRLT